MKGAEPVKASSGRTRMSTFLGGEASRRVSARAIFSVTSPKSGANCRQAIRILECRGVGYQTLKGECRGEGKFDEPAVFWSVA